MLHLCVPNMLECALTTGFGAPLTNMCPLIAAFQASCLCTDDPQKNNLYAFSALSLESSGFRSFSLSSLPPRITHNNNGGLFRFIVIGDIVNEQIQWIRIDGHLY